MTVLITGASSGIGLEFAKIFARKGNDLVLVARRVGLLQELKQSIQSDYDVRIDLIVKDLSTDGSAKEVFDQLQGREIDVLVNNAGFGDFALFVDGDWQKYDSMMHLNMLTLTHLSKLLVPQMITRQSGKILNIASTAAFMPGPLMAVYFGTKAYVLSFSEALANELAGTGVSVTTLCPGATATGFEKEAASETGNLFGKSIPTGVEVAEFGYASLMSGKRLAIHGFKNRLMIFMSRFIPRGLVAKITRSIME